jgi:hypothetical protein
VVVYGQGAEGGILGRERARLQLIENWWFAGVVLYRVLARALH